MYSERCDVLLHHVIQYVTLCRMHMHVWSVLSGWYDTAFNILTVNIVLLVICCCLLLVCTCFAFAARYKPEAPVKKDIAALVLLYVSLFVLIISSKCICNLNDFVQYVEMVIMYECCYLFIRLFLTIAECV